MSKEELLIQSPTTMKRNVTTPDRDIKIYRWIIAQRVRQIKMWTYCFCINFVKVSKFELTRLPSLSKRFIILDRSYRNWVGLAFFQLSFFKDLMRTWRWDAKKFGPLPSDFLFNSNSRTLYKHKPWNYYYLTKDDFHRQIMEPTEKLLFGIVLLLTPNDQIFNGVKMKINMNIKVKKGSHFWRCHYFAFKTNQLPLQILVE